MSTASSSANRLRHALRLVGMLCLLAFVAGLLGSCGRGSGNDAPAVFSPSDWSRRTLDDVTIEAPFEFGPGPDVTAKLPPGSPQPHRVHADLPEQRHF